jgi:hypothetical protein
VKLKDGTIQRLQQKDASSGGDGDVDARIVELQQEVVQLKEQVRVALSARYWLFIPLHMGLLAAPYTRLLFAIVAAGALPRDHPLAHGCGQV